MSDPSDIRIGTFRSEDWRAYRDARLAALREAPDAFATTWAESASREDAHWQSRVTDLDPAREHPIAAWSHNTVAGLAWARIDDDQPRIAHVFQMWAAPEFRGRGIARQMLESAVQWARQSDVDAVHLGVTTSQVAARRLYESMGFVADGDPEPLREGSHLKVQPMVLTLAERPLASRRT